MLLGEILYTSIYAWVAMETYWKVRQFICFPTITMLVLNFHFTFENQLKTLSTQNSVIDKQ